jgi:S-adenosylmethionine decarboxylase
MFSGKLGVHWIVDAIDCHAPSIADLAHLEEVLTSVPDELGLVRVEKARTFQHEEEGETTLAGIVLISESHFSIHVRPHLRLVHADLFSCRTFDANKALVLLRAAYGFTRYEEHLLPRGRMP